MIASDYTQCESIVKLKKLYALNVGKLARDEYVRSCPVECEKLETALFYWLQGQEAMTLCLMGHICITKAKELVEKYRSLPAKQSPGPVLGRLVCRLQAAHGNQKACLEGKATSDDQAGIQLAETMLCELLQKMRKYGVVDPEDSYPDSFRCFPASDIHNMNETSLFWRQVRNLSGYW